MSLELCPRIHKVMAALLEMAELYGVWAADIVREVEEARRAERLEWAARVRKE